MSETQFFLTRDEFNEYLAEFDKDFNYLDDAIEHILKDIERIEEALDAHERVLNLHDDMFHQLGNRQRTMNRYIDWTGRGRPLSPTNIAISTTYDKFNRTPTSGKSGCMGMIIMLSSVCMGLVLVLTLGG